MNRTTIIAAAVFAAAASPSHAAPPPLAKQQAYSWSDGLIQYSSITNCVSIIQGTPYLESGAGTYVGFYADANATQPSPNQTYYVHVVVAGLGNACSGIRAYIEVALPTNTSLAISQTNKVFYYYDGAPLPANESPQSLPASSYNPGAFAVYSVDNVNAYTWPIPVGRTLEIQIPVISSTPLTNSTFQANVHMLDGNSSPWLHPQIGIFVFGTTPSIFYSQPSTTSIARTTAHSVATLYSGGVAGTGYFDLGTTTSYGLIRDAVTITSANTSWQVWDDWGPPALTPGTLYHWRFTFTTNGQTYYGADQTFTTLEAPSVIGTPAPGAGVSRTATRSTSGFDAAGRSIARANAQPLARASAAGVSFSKDGAVQRK